MKRPDWRAWGSKTRAWLENRKRVAGVIGGIVFLVLAAALIMVGRANIPSATVAGKEFTRSAAAAITDGFQPLTAKVNEHTEVLKRNALVLAALQKRADEMAGKLEDQERRLQVQEKKPDADLKGLTDTIQERLRKELRSELEPIKQALVELKANPPERPAA